MIFAAPWALLALFALPLLWWLLRATPPAPKREVFPAIRLLRELPRTEETPARTPPWLLLLRMAAAALLIGGVADPILRAARFAFASRGDIVLVFDTGWSCSPDFVARRNAAEAVIARAGRDGRRIRLLATAPENALAPVSISEPLPASVAASRIAALHPEPWPEDHVTAACALATAHVHGLVFYIGAEAQPQADVKPFTAGGGGGEQCEAWWRGQDPNDRFARTLASVGPVTEFRGGTPLLLAASPTEATLTAEIKTLPAPTERHLDIVAEAADGRPFGRATATVAAGVTAGQASVTLPTPIRNEVAALRLLGTPGAGSVALLDSSARRHPVALLGSPRAETPLLGSLYYLQRALAPATDLRTSDALDPLLAGHPAVLGIADRTLSPDEQKRLAAWVDAGGTLLRFAGPDFAGADDTLLPTPLLPGDRQLGGAMSWTASQRLAPFPPESPFAGLPTPAEVTVSRQVLADPATIGGADIWARLADGTPLVTASARGAGTLVFFHVPPNADWSNLPLSGLFVRMLDRIVGRSAGVGAADGGRGDAPLAPALTLNGEGNLGPPPPGAEALTGVSIANTEPSPLHPPGYYGPERDRHALSLARLALVRRAPIPGATLRPLDAAPRERPLGPWCFAAALALLAADMSATLALRGLLRPALAAVLFAFAPVAGTARAEDSYALATHLAYVVTGDTDTDNVSKLGLESLSAYMNAHTAAVMAAPVGVVPGRDDLSFFPLLYWPIRDGSGASGPKTITALNNFMATGGLLLIDTRASSGDPANGSAAALRRATEGLDIPRLEPLSDAHVLARSFYLLRDFPGRYASGTVWVERAADRSNDDVSPLIVGSNDWAAAWAEDEDGRPFYAAIPGGERQRTLAFRFGVNVVMYALTGNYKGDQVHVPAILERLGQ